MKLGDKVFYSATIEKGKAWSWLPEILKETLKFCDKHGLKYFEDVRFSDGRYIDCNKRIFTLKKEKHGIIVGKRTIDLNGTLDDGMWTFKKRLSVYLIASDMRSIVRVPEEYIRLMDLPNEEPKDESGNI